MLKTSLRYLMSVARHGSIRAASNELNIAQSAVSRRLQALEYQIGTPLFERKPRGVTLTEAGKLLYAHCLDTTFALDRLYSEIDELKGLRRGLVRLAAMESVVTSALSSAIHTFRSKYPDIIFNVDILTSDKIMEIVREGDVDFGVTFGTEFSDDIHVVYHSSERLYVAMRPDHPLARKKSIGVRDLVSLPIALTPPKSSSRAVFDKGCAKAGLSLKPTLETNSIELMHQFALAGTGVTFMLRHVGIASVKSGELCTIPLEGKDFSSDVSIITLKDRKLPLAAESFLMTMQRELSRLPFPAAIDAARASARSK